MTAIKANKVRDLQVIQLSPSHLDVKDVLYVGVIHYTKYATTDHSICRYSKLRKYAMHSDCE